MRYLIPLLGLLLALTACSNKTPTISVPPSSNGTCTPDWSTPDATKPSNTTPLMTKTPVGEGGANKSFSEFSVSYTHQQADGNRIVAGSGQLPNLTPIDIPLPGPASWVVAIPWEGGSLWAVTLTDGQVLGFQVDAQGWQPVEISPPNLEAGQPPLLLGDDKIFGLLTSSSTLASPLTHPIPLQASKISQAFISIEGDLILVDENNELYSQISTDALADTRILSDDAGRLLFLTNPTDQYEHGVLGDSLEAGSITRIDAPQAGQISIVIQMPDDLVLEGIAPIWDT